ncbi:hypothetical protein CHS0354_027455, partial [Potamilus streckersoni]
DLNLSGAHRLDNRPTLMDVQRAFRGAKYLASIGSISVSIILVIVWPSFMVLADVMSFNAFSQWVQVSKVWAFLATIFIIATPLVSEVYNIYKIIVTRRQVGNASIEVDIQDNSSSSKSPYHRSSLEESYGYQDNNLLYINEMRSPVTHITVKTTSTEFNNSSAVNESVHIQSPKSCASSSFESQSVFP